MPDVSLKHFANMNSPTPKCPSKGGRPRKPENEQRLHPVKVYFDEQSYRKLLNKRRRTGMSLSTLVYELTVNGYVKEPFTKEEISLLRSLAGMANNLNQLAHEAHFHNFSEVEERVLQLANKINEILIQISEQ
jgi:hypothetical protein